MSMNPIVGRTKASTRSGPAAGWTLLFASVLTFTTLAGHPQTPTIFDDGFETGGLARWSAVRLEAPRTAFELLVRLLESDVSDLTAEYDLEIIERIDDGAETLLLVESGGETAQNELEGALQADPRVFFVEVEQTGATPETQSFDIGQKRIDDMHKAGPTERPCLAGMGGGIWRGWAEQDALAAVRLPEADSEVSCGAVTVAVIDTGVDPRHPLLAGALLEGYDFLLERPGASEWDSLDESSSHEIEDELVAKAEQSITALLEGGGAPVNVEQSITALLEQSITALLEDKDLPSGFGHGTMVAGLVRVVSPTSTILPIRVFNGNGEAALFDVIQGIRYAVEQGAEVINLSFSLRQDSRELEDTIRWAADRGVILVAAAGNQGQETFVYPAGLKDVIGVASTNNDDVVSAFSNYGERIADLAAPGEAVISLYPGGLFAAGWGTSFSTPLVAGAAARLLSELTSEPDSIIDALKDGAQELPVDNDAVDEGRLDIEGAWLELGGDGDDDGKGG